MTNWEVMGGVVCGEPAANSVSFRSDPGYVQVVVRARAHACPIMHGHGESLSFWRQAERFRG